MGVATTTERARELRRNAAPAERKLWRLLRDLPLPESHFRRQMPIGTYVADFACLKAKLIVELDGDQHAVGVGPNRDARRNSWFESQGFLTLRFWNRDVLENPEGIAETIFRIANDRLGKSPPP